MKKTINANIGGMIFHLDEDAFEKCKSYLDTLKTKFGGIDGGEEIISDIEFRIAEIFKEKLGGIREVVSVEDVNDMVAIMGDPNSFIDEETTTTSGAGPAAELPRQKRLFRDPENRVIGGVCSGFGAYLNMDPWIVRAIMICLVLFGGVSFLLYFIFWIAMPKAVTTSDRLMMRGKKVDVNSIEESVKKEWNETKTGLKNMSRSAKSSSFVNGIGKFFRITIGVGFLLFSTLILGGFVWAMLSSHATVHIDNLHISLKDASGLIFDSFGETMIAYIAAWLLIFVPGVLSIYLGIRAILQFKHKLRYVMFGGFMLWLIGLVLGIYVVMGVLSKNSQQATTRENLPVMISDSTIIQVSAVDHDQIQGYNLQGYPISIVDFDIEKNSTDSFPTLEIEKFSQGKNKQIAFDLAQKINYYQRIDGNKIQLATYFMLDKGDKFRGQHIQVKLKLPVGYKVYLAKGTEELISDISNIQEVWDHNMPEHTWTMTKEGLNCDDCEEDIIRKGKHDHEEEDEDGNVKIKVTTEDGEHHVEVN